MAEIRMPKMGDGMEEGTINAWLVKEGDKITSGDPIAEVETDKANVEIQGYETGVLTKIVVQVGETVPIGAVIAIVGGSASATAPAPVAQASAPASVEAKPASADRPLVEVGGRQSESLNGNHAPSTERVKASPLARAMAKQHGLDLARVHGTGPGGRIKERDVQSYLDTQEAQPAVAVAVEAAPIVEIPAPRPVVTAPVAGAQDTKPNNMRTAIARRTVQSKQNIPHFYVTMVVEMDRAMALLKELNADATAGKVTVNDIIVKSCAIALGKVPQANTSWTSEGMVRQYSEAHIGVAVGIDDGLIIPVVRDCHAKTLRQISADAKSLITKARNNQLKPDEYTGGTFTVSNLGMMGVDVFTAIINPPEAAILAIGGISRDVVTEGDDDKFVVRSRMKITLSADHRLLDGVVAAKFLNEVKKLLEAPFSLLS